MKKIIFMIIAVMLLAACTTTKEVLIEGDNKKEVIESEEPIEIEILGDENTVIVKENTTVTQVIFNGNRNRMTLPKGVEPEIIQVGNDNLVRNR